MTGYGRAKKTLSNRDITVEVRSVNNRYLDCTVKLPRAYIFAEDAIKGRVQKAISRGKVDVFVTIDSTGADEEVVVVNEGLARSYLEALRKLYEIDGGNYLQKQSYAADLARIPDVLTVTKAEEDLESVGADICEVLDEALASYNQMRATEGKKLAEDIGGRLTTIETLTGKVEERSPETVREYREKLTARTQEADKVNGLMNGADDYVTKPFRPQILGAKVKALIRRSKSFSQENSQQISCGPFLCDTTTMRFYKNNVELNLSEKERSLLLLFVRHPQQVFTKDMIYEQIWGNLIAVDDNAIMVYINRLRSKIEDNASTPQQIGRAHV